MRTLRFVTFALSGIVGARLLLRRTVALNMATELNHVIDVLDDLTILFGCFSHDDPLFRLVRPGVRSPAALTEQRLYAQFVPQLII